MTTATHAPKELGSIPLTPVASSNLHAVGYDEDAQTVAVQFKNGHVVHYPGVHPKVWAAFDGAPSKGSFYSHEIKGMYQSRKITGACADCGDIGVLDETCTSCGCANYTSRT